MAHPKHPVVSAYTGALLLLLVPFTFTYAQATGTTTSATTDPAQIQAEMTAQLQEILNMYRSQIPTPQAIQNSGIERSIILKSSPETPAAHEAVTFTLGSALTDLDRATIAWYQNGVLKESGKGKRVFSATTGNFGSTLTISAVVFTAEGISATRRISFKPLDIEISWETDTYTPPFYKGKALPSAQSSVRLSARVLGSSVNPSTFTYRWKKDGVVLSQVSGYGKSAVPLTKAIASTGNLFEVSVFGADGSFIGKESITIRPVSPLVLFYEDRPLEGIRYQNALSGSIVALGNEFTLRTEPFYVSREDRLGGRVLYQWTINGNPVATNPASTAPVLGEYGAHRLTVINTTSAKEDVSVSFGVQNTTNALQAGKRIITLILGAKNAPGMSF